MQPPPVLVPHPPSRRSQVVRLATSLTLKPVALAVPDSDLGVALSRRILAGAMALGGRTARGVEVTPIDSDVVSRGRIKGEWARPEGARDDGVVLYIHGSGYNLCSTRTHRPLVTQIAAMSGLAVFSTEYRLAPRHRFPAAADDVARAYVWLLDQGWDADQVVVAGDSAGGHLTLDLALELHRQGRDLPAALVMFSPLADVTFELSRGREQARPDPMITAAAARRLVARYVADTDPDHPRLTHVLVPGEKLPPTLIQAGGAEMLAADARHLHHMLIASGTDSRLEIWPGQMHVFQAAPRAVPEAHRALRRAASFITTALAASAARRTDSTEGVTA